MGLRNPELFISIGSTSGALEYGRQAAARMRGEMPPRAPRERTPEQEARRRQPNPLIGIDGFSSQIERTPSGTMFETPAQADAYDPFTLITEVSRGGPAAHLPGLRHRGSADRRRPEAGRLHDGGGDSLRLHADAGPPQRGLLDRGHRPHHGRAVRSDAGARSASGRSGGAARRTDSRRSGHRPPCFEVVDLAATAALDDSFFRVRFDRLTPSERRYLRAMAELGPGPHRSGDIADVLGRPVTSLGLTRSRLITKGMVWSPGHGDTDFTVPLFDEFMRRTMPDDDWRQ